MTTIANDLRLNWVWHDGYREAELGVTGDGARFTLSRHPTCYRRGQWRLLVEIYCGEGHHKWGCFDDADQPMRWYHSEDAARSEAEAIAAVLSSDRRKHD